MRETATKMPSRKLSPESRASLLTMSAQMLRATFAAVRSYRQDQREQGRSEAVAFIRRYPLTPNASYRAYPEADAVQTVRRALAVSEQLDRFVTDTPDHIVDSGACDAAYAELLRNVDGNL